MRVLGIAACVALAAGQAPEHWPAKIGIGDLRTVTVTPRRGGQPETWTRSTGNNGRLTRSVVAIRSGGSNEVVTVDSDGSTRNIRMDYDAGRLKGSKILQNGRVVEDTLSTNAAIMQRMRELQSKVDRYGRGGGAAGEFDIKTPGGGGAAINWDCEKAAVTVIVWCGVFDISKCGESVNNQFCQCAPSPKPASCK